MKSSIGKKRIWIYSRKLPPEHSGAANRCSRHAKSLSKLGFNITIITTTNEPDHIEGVKIITLRGILKPNIVTSYTNLLMVYLGFKKNINDLGKPDLIHKFGAGITAFPISLICRKYDIKSIIETVVTLPKVSLIYKFKPNYYLRKFGISKADQIIAISEGVKQSIRNHGINNEIQIVNNGVDIERFSVNSSNTKKIFREKLNLPVKPILILMVGAVCLRKGHDVALKVLNILSNNRDVRLIAVGPYNTKSLNDIKENCTTEEFNLLHSSKVILAGKRYDVEDFYKACDVFLFPSRKEGFGNVLIEAMASRIPVISSKIEGITDSILEDGKTGFLISNIDVRKFAERVEEIILNEDLKKMITDSAFEKAKITYDNKIIYGKYKSIYNSN